MQICAKKSKVITKYNDIKFIIIMNNAQKSTKIKKYCDTKHFRFGIQLKGKKYSR